MAKTDIIQELNDLGSGLANHSSENIYSVPEGYFEGFAGQVLGRIKAGNEGSEFLSSLPKENPYQAPVGYFDGLEERIMDFIRNHADYQSTKEELESISPLLNSIRKEPVYSVPQGYFENFQVPVEPKSQTKVVSLFNRKLMRYAAAVVIFAVIGTGGILIYKNNHKDAAGRTLAKFEKEVKKINDVNQTQIMIDFIDAGLNEKTLAQNDKNFKGDDVQKLLQDISVDELQDFTDQSKDIEDVMMTN